MFFFNITYIEENADAGTLSKKLTIVGILQDRQHVEKSIDDI